MNNSFQTNWNQHWILGPKCANGTNGTNNPCENSGFIAAGFISDFVSILSSVLIILLFVSFRDMRTQARKFLFYISIADVFNSSWFLFAHVWSLFRIDYSTCYRGKTIVELYFCILQATMNVYFTIVSSYWTIILAVYILSLLYNKELFVSSKSKFLLGLVGWGIPILLALFGLLTNQLGPGRGTASAGWCFISDYSTETYPTSIHAVTEFIGGNLFDILTLLILTVVYAIAFVKCTKERRKHNTGWITEGDMKLALIPMAYILLRLWGTLRSFLTLMEDVNKQPRLCYPILMYMQAIGDPGQGWVNGILFLLLTKELRKRVYQKFMELKRRGTTREMFLIPSSNLVVYYNTIHREDIFTPELPDV